MNNKTKTVGNEDLDEKKKNEVSCLKIKFLINIPKNFF